MFYPLIRTFGYILIHLLLIKYEFLKVKEKKKEK